MHHYVHSKFRRITIIFHTKLYQNKLPHRPGRKRLHNVKSDKQFISDILSTVDTQSAAHSVRALKQKNYFCDRTQPVYNRRPPADTSLHRSVVPV